MKKLAIIVLLFSLGGCIDKAERRLEELRPHTLKIGEHFYDHLKHGRTDSAVALFASGFIEKQAVKYLVDLPSHHAGAVKEANLVGSEQTITIQGSKREEYLKNNYSVSYANGQTFKESLTFMVDGSKNGISKIDKYSFETTDSTK